MKPSTIAALASDISSALKLSPRLTKAEAVKTFARIAKNCQTRRQAAEKLAIDFFDLNPEDEVDANRIQRAIACA